MREGCHYGCIPLFHLRGYETHLYQMDMGWHMAQDFTRLKRNRHVMPEYIRQALEQNGVASDYAKRPAYQQNDYIGWIERAKRQQTREKRLQQMIDELKKGGVYMNMKHPASDRA